MLKPTFSLPLACLSVGALLTVARPSFAADPAPPVSAAPLPALPPPGPAPAGAAPPAAAPVSAAPPGPPPGYYPPGYPVPPGAAPPGTYPYPSPYYGVDPRVRVGPPTEMNYVEGRTIP